MLSKIGSRQVFVITPAGEVEEALPACEDAADDVAPGVLMDARYGAFFRSKPCVHEGEVNGCAAVPCAVVPWSNLCVDDENHPTSYVRCRENHPVVSSALVRLDG